MPTAQITLGKNVATGEEITLPAPGVRAGGVIPHSGRATIDGVDQPATEFNVDYELETVIAKNNSPMAWEEDAILVVTWDSVSASTGGEGEYLPLTGGIMSGPISFGSQWLIGRQGGGFYISQLVGETPVPKLNLSPAVSVFSGSVQIDVGAGPGFLSLLTATPSVPIFISSARTTAEGSAARWRLILADETPEPGDGSGSNFSLESCSDIGLTTGRPFTINRATGRLTLSTAPTINGLVNALDDAAAATAGVPVNGMYRNGSVLMVRVV